MTRREFIKGTLASVLAGGSQFTATVADTINYLPPNNLGASRLSRPSIGDTLPKWTRGNFRISVLYTGRSESTFLIFPDSTSMLIDCGDCCEDVHKDCLGGPFKDSSLMAGERTASWVLEENPGGSKVDYFLLSHYHHDHVGGHSPHAKRSKRGNYSLCGFGCALEVLDFDTIIDRAWPDLDDPSPRHDRWVHTSFVRECYEEALRRGTKIERFRLEKDFGQIALRHGGCKGFKATPLCANGCILRRDGSLLDLATLSGGAKTRAAFGENELSAGLVFSLGPFRYFTAGDFTGGLKAKNGTRIDFEEVLAAECPKVDVAKASHHGANSMPRALAKALSPQVLLAAVCHRGHVNRRTLRNFSGRNCLVAPGFFPPARLGEDAKEPWFTNLALEAAKCIHTVIDVSPDGRDFALMTVAADGSRRILGTYDFTASPKGDVP